jgi:hypothetical protein
MLFAFSESDMEPKFHENDENIAKLLDKVVTMCRQTGLSELATKCDKILKNYQKSNIIR